jgi:pimeloyl-ACP methyl ester carboxylesterase
MQIVIRTFLLFVIFSAITSYGQEHSTQNLEINSFIDGTLLQPKEKKSNTLIIIIAGSGPTNRDGNSTIGKNNSLKQLAYFLADEGFASFRYDKRILKLIRNNTLNEDKLRFEDFVKDASDVTSYFKLFNDDKYNFDSYILVGHSQGALVAMLASLRTAVDGLVLLCGTAQPLDKLLVSQLSKQAPFLMSEFKVALDSIKSVGYVKEYNPLLKTYIHEDVQPFMRSWMLNDPIEIAKKITVPTLVIGGTTDIQIPANDAKLLAENLPNGNYAIIENMNHVLKTVADVGLENQRSYTNPNYPLSEGLKLEISKFLEDFK